MSAFAVSVVKKTGHGAGSDGTEAHAILSGVGFILQAFGSHTEVTQSYLCFRKMTAYKVDLRMAQRGQN